MPALEILSKALNVAILIFLVSTMLGVGSSLTLKEIIAPLRNARLVVSSLVASYLLVPLIAVILTRLFALEEPLRIGLVLLSMAGGVEAGPKLVAIAKASVAFSVGLMVIQLPITIVYIPLVMHLVLPEVKVNTGLLLVKLLLSVFLPLSSGLYLKARHPSRADRLSPYLHKASTILIVLVTVGLIVVNFKQILQLADSNAIPAALIFIAAASLVGYLLGGPGIDTRRTLLLMTGARNGSISLVIASQVFSDHKVTLMIIATVILMLVILLPASVYMGRSSTALALERASKA